MQVSVIPVYKITTGTRVQNKQFKKNNFEQGRDSVSFSGKNIPNDLKNVDFSLLTEHSFGVLDVINTGTFAQILKFRPQNAVYAIKRLYPNKIIQPQDDLVPTKRLSLQEQLSSEVEAYKRLDGVEGIPRMYLFNIGDSNNLLNNYIVTSWAEGKTSSSDGAIYDTELVLNNLSGIYKTLKVFDKRGIFHGDLWAGNILFSKNDAKIIDFNHSKQFNSDEKTDFSNFDDFKKRFLNVFLSDVYHRYGKEKFLEVYKYCLKLECDFNDNVNSETRYLLENPQMLENFGIKMIYESNIYWAQMMKIRKTQGDYRYYQERAVKLKSENPEILGGVK